MGTPGGGGAAEGWRARRLELERRSLEGLGLELGARAGVGGPRGSEEETVAGVEGAWHWREISGETCVGWGEDTTLEPGEVCAGSRGQGRRRRMNGERRVSG